MINLVSKIMNEKGKVTSSEELEKEFVDSYGAVPPISIEEILREMKYRGKL